MSNLKEFRKFEYDYDVFTDETEKSKEVTEELKKKRLDLENTCFKIEEDEETGELFLRIYFGFEDFCTEEDEDFFDSFINSSFGKLKHVTCFDGGNEEYKFPLGQTAKDVELFILDHLDDINNITEKYMRLE